jgi:hypothetical protein
VTDRELLLEAEAALTACWKKLLTLKPVLGQEWERTEPVARWGHDVTMTVRRHLAVDPGCVRPHD